MQLKLVSAVFKDLFRIYYISRHISRYTTALIFSLSFGRSLFARVWCESLDDNEFDLQMFKAKKTSNRAHGNRLLPGGP